MNSTKCPVCHSVDVKLLFSLDSKITADLLFPAESTKASEIKQIIDKIWQTNQSYFYKCNKCYFVYAEPFISGSTEFYSLLYYSNFEYPIQKWEYSKTIEMLKSLIRTKDFKVLEIGAGNGTFISQLIDYKIVAKENIYATEYSNAAISAIKSKGVFCTNSNIYDLKNQKKLPLFDMIFMFQVLEHLDNIDAVFNTLNSISASHASFIFAVPNSKFRNFLDKRGIHYDIPPVHIGKYNLNSFKFIAQKYNWQVISHAVEPMRYLNKVKKFIFERYWKNKHTIRIEKSNHTIIKHFYRYLFLAFICLNHFYIIFSLFRRDFGTSFWIHLKKTA